MSKQWFVARTKTSQEVRASVSVASCGFDVFLPIHTVRRTHGGKTENVSRPLYPRYVFVAFDPAAEAHGCINNCRGVANRGLIVTASGAPVRVPDAVIANIRAGEMAMRAHAGEVTTGYLPGETFELQRGRHSAITAQYMGEENGKVFALVNMFGKGHVIEVDYAVVPSKKYVDGLCA